MLLRILLRRSSNVTAFSVSKAQSPTMPSKGQELNNFVTAVNRPRTFMVWETHFKSIPALPKINETIK